MAKWQYRMRLATAAVILLGSPAGMAQGIAPKVETGQASAPDKPLDKMPMPDDGPPAGGSLPDADKGSDIAGAGLSVDDTIAGLSALNITYSVEENLLREWLANADYTPYPAVAARLIAILHGRRLANPLDLDVIVYDYENTPGIRSPRRIGDVKEEALIAALLKSYNVRHGASARALSEIAR